MLPPSPPKGAKNAKILKTWPASVHYITQDNITTVFTFGSMELKCVISRNAVNADRIMKFIDENELNYI